MKKIILATAATLALSLLTVDAFADHAAQGKDQKMGDMKMDCMHDIKDMKDMHDMKDMKDMKGMEGMKMDCHKKTAGNAVSMAEGEVKEVDMAGKSITLKHGPIKSKTVEMSAMTMTFAVKDAAMLSKIKSGDSVRFQVETVSGQPTVVELAKRGG